MIFDAQIKVYFKQDFMVHIKKEENKARKEKYHTLQVSTMNGPALEGRFTGVSQTKIRVQHFVYVCTS